LGQSTNDSEGMLCFKRFNTNIKLVHWIPTVVQNCTTQNTLGSQSYTTGMALLKVINMVS
jgi:hypothetical protein